MSRVLSVVLYGEHVADLTQTDGGRHELVYREGSTSGAISTSMPPRTTPYRHRVVEPFIEGILPDRESTRFSLGERFGVSGRNPFALLEHIGLECAGAVQFCHPDQLVDVLNGRGSLIPATEQDIGRRLRSLRADDSGSWIAEQESWSLPGAQGKFAMRRDGDGWFVATGSEPTTHILKPGVSEFRYHERARLPRDCASTWAAGSHHQLRGVRPATRSSTVNRRSSSSDTTASVLRTATLCVSTRRTCVRRWASIPATSTSPREAHAP